MAEKPRNCFPPLHYSTNNSTQVCKWECKLIQLFLMGTVRWKVLQSLLRGSDRLTIWTNKNDSKRRCAQEDKLRTARKSFTLSFHLSSLCFFFTSSRNHCVTYFANLLPLTSSVFNFWRVGFVHCFINNN